MWKEYRGCSAWNFQCLKCTTNRIQFLFQRKIHEVVCPYPSHSPCLEETLLMDDDTSPIEPRWPVSYPSDWVHKVKPTYFPDLRHLEAPFQQHSQVMTQLMSEHLPRLETHSHKDSIFHLQNSIRKPFLGILPGEHRDRTPALAISASFQNFIKICLKIKAMDYSWPLQGKKKKHDKNSRGIFSHCIDKDWWKSTFLE